MAGFSRRSSSGWIPLDGGVDEYHDPIEVAKNRKLSAVDCHIDGGKLTFRPGKRVWGPEFGAVCNGIHEYIDPDGVARLLVAADGYVYEVDSEDKTARDSGLADEELHFFTHRGRCRYNGANTQRKITRTTAERVGVIAPAGAPTATYGGTGLTGNYAWKYTFVIEVDGVRMWESNPSPMLQYTLSNNVATLKGDASLDDRVNARYFYRTTASGNVWQYTGKISDNVAASTLVDSTTDANLEEILETNHGVPVQGSIAEGANERQYFIVGQNLYWSEQAYTESYLEYQKPLNFKELPQTGSGSGLRRLYNSNTAREDLYVFQTETTHVLPDADPNKPLVTLSQVKGCIQHDTIVEYNNGLVFLSNKKSVEYLRGGRLIDISTRSIPKSLTKLLTTTKARGALIFDHYYALSCRDDASKIYNHQVWVCDLRSIQEVKEGQADAVWYKWNINAEYMIQLAGGSVLAFDNQAQRLFEYKKEYRNDGNAAGTISNITCSFQTKDFTQGMFTRTKPHMVVIKGQQTGTMQITPYYGNNYRGSSSNMINVGAGSVAIAGKAVLGQSTLTQIPIKIEGPISSNVAGVWIGFLFSKTGTDLYFDISGFEYTFTVYKRT
jgi:hypothetical protein